MYCVRKKMYKMILYIYREGNENKYGKQKKWKFNFAHFLLPGNLYD